MVYKGLPVYTDGQGYAAGATIRYGNTIYAAKVDIQTAPIVFNEDDWVAVGVSGDAFAALEARVAALESA